MENTHIFISYRRDDAMGASGRVWDWLRIGFGRERVFRDVGSIGAGKWRDKIDAALACSRACVAVIGRRWADETNLPRLMEPDDMVRHELVTALARGECGELTMVPLLVEEAKLRDIPLKKLPELLKPLLAEWNVLALTESGWDDDTRRLITVIAEATGLPIRQDLEEWMCLMMGAERGLASRETDRQLISMAQSGGRDSLEALVRKVAESAPEEQPNLKAAFEALSIGDTLLAEEAFEREVEAGDQLIAAAAELITAERSRQADAAYHVASLALIRGDLSKALRFQRKVLEYDPDHMMAALQMGYALLSMGSREAEAHFKDLLNRANNLANDTMRARALIGIGDVLMSQGDGPGALNAFRAGVSISEALTRRDPANPDWLRDLALGHERIGNAKAIQGNTPGAMKAYRTSLDIIEALNKQDPANTQWQSDLSVIYNNVGNFLMSQRNLSSALNSYRAGLKMAIALAEYDPDNLLWQREKSVRYVNIGNVLKARGDSREALNNYHAGLEIREALSRKDPSNTDWQIDLAISCGRLGSLVQALGKEDCRSYLSRGREILETLKSTGKLPKNKNCISWFDDQLRKIEKD